MSMKTILLTEEDYRNLIDVLARVAGLPTGYYDQNVIRGLASDADVIQGTIQSTVRNEDDAGPYVEVENGGHVTILDRFGNVVEEFDEEEEEDEEDEEPEPDLSGNFMKAVLDGEAERDEEDEEEREELGEDVTGLSAEPYPFANFPN